MVDFHEHHEARVIRRRIPCKRTDGYIRTLIADAIGFWNLRRPCFSRHPISRNSCALAVPATAKTAVANATIIIIDFIVASSIMEPHRAAKVGSLAACRTSAQPGNSVDTRGSFATGTIPRLTLDRLTWIKGDIRCCR